VEVVRRYIRERRQEEDERYAQMKLRVQDRRLGRRTVLRRL
jgi:hypothetical protein